MKIIHTKSGKAYHLDPDTQLEVERTNPFFNEVGEQTLPVTLPDSDHNRAILGYPESLANRQKPSQNIDATIRDGEYFTACRQAILGAKRKEGIETAFYMNEGAFFGRIPDTRLTTVFAGETIPGITTVQQGIAFCRNLLFNGHEIYAIFPVLTKGDDDDYPKWLNRLEYMKSNGDYIISDGSEYPSMFDYFGFYNEFDRTETVDDYTIQVSKGYYMTPFIRANYVLRRMFAHFGYTLQETFFETTYPFTDMVFINNTDDTLANGDIRITDLIPDIMCSTLLNLYRKKFNCEFIPDELNKTVKIEFLKDVLSGIASTDLSGCVDGELSLSFPKYKQLKLSSKDTIADGNQYDCVTEIVSKFPTAWMDASSGNYYRRGLSVDAKGKLTDVTEMLSSSAIPYLLNEKNEIESIEVPDCAIVMKFPKFKEIPEPVGNVVRYPRKRYSGRFHHPYIGETRALNSTVVYDDKEEEEEDNKLSEKSATANNDEQLPMLAFACFHNDTGSFPIRTDNDNLTYCIGTINNYTPFNNKFSDYSLLYNGHAGIFEAFYRPYDDLLRNSMHTVKAKMLLSQHLKLTVPAHRKVIINSQELLINKLSFTLGGKNEPQESEFFTTHLFEPVESAMPEKDRIPVSCGSLNPHKWTIVQTSHVISQAEYNASPYKGVSVPLFYLPYPDPGRFAPGYVFLDAKTAYVVISGSRYLLDTVTITFQ
jgi:hypothetical protein